MKRWCIFTRTENIDPVIAKSKVSSTGANAWPCKTGERIVLALSIVDIGYKA